MLIYNAHLEVPIKRWIQFDAWDILLPMAVCIVLAFDELKSVIHLRVQNAVMHGQALTLYVVLRRMETASLAEPNQWNPYFHCFRNAFKLKYIL